MSKDLAYKDISELSEDLTPDVATAFIPVAFDNELEMKKARITNLYPIAAAIIDVTGGSVIDIEGRVATNKILTAMRANGWVTP